MAERSPKRNVETLCKGLFKGLGLEHRRRPYSAVAFHEMRLLPTVPPPAEPGYGMPSCSGTRLHAVSCYVQQAAAACSEQHMSPSAGASGIDQVVLREALSRQTGTCTTMSCATIADDGSRWRRKAKPHVTATSPDSSGALLHASAAFPVPVEKMRKTKAV